VGGSVMDVPINGEQTTSQDRTGTAMMDDATADLAAKHAERLRHAVAVWDRARGALPAPRHVDSLKQKKKAAIYRFCGAGPDGANVIAKRVPRRAAAERVVYESVLPHLPVTAARCFGSCDDEDGDTYWLFLEDLGSDECRFSRTEHLALATRWIAGAHAAAASLPAPAGLSDAGPGRYRDHLCSARAKLLTNLSNPHIAPAQGAALKELIVELEAIERGWDDVDAACAGVPATLVHGDYRPKNVHVRFTGGAVQCFPLDWETAGWGCPAVDLCDVDPDIYRSGVAHAWPHVSRDDLLRLASVGRAFRWMAAIDWESSCLQFPYPEKHLMRLSVYRSGLAEAMRGIDARNARSDGK